MENKDDKDFKLPGAMATAQENIMLELGTVKRASEQYTVEYQTMLNRTADKDLSEVSEDYMKMMEKADHLIQQQTSLIGLLERQNSRLQVEVRSLSKQTPASLPPGQIRGHAHIPAKVGGVLVDQIRSIPASEIYKQARGLGISVSSGDYRLMCSAASGYLEVKKKYLTLIQCKNSNLPLDTNEIDGTGINDNLSRALVIKDNKKHTNNHGEEHGNEDDEESGKRPAKKTKTDDNDEEGNEEALGADELAKSSSQKGTSIYNRNPDLMIDHKKGRMGVKDDIMKHINDGELNNSFSNTNPTSLEQVVMEGINSPPIGERNDPSHSSEPIDHEHEGDFDEDKIQKEEVMGSGKKKKRKSKRRLEQTKK